MLPILLMLTIGTDTDAHTSIVDHFAEPRQCQIAQHAMHAQLAQSGEGHAFVAHSDCVDTRAEATSFSPATR